MLHTAMYITLILLLGSPWPSCPPSLRIGFIFISQENSIPKKNMN